MSEWRDIETAPKDGTVILMADGLTMFCGIWLKSARGWVDGCRDDDGELVAWNATHWMPLPAPPKQDNAP
jgi:hypothetical protein